MALVATALIERNEARRSFLSEASKLNILFARSPAPGILGTAARNALAALRPRSSLYAGSGDDLDCFDTIVPQDEECQLRHAGQIEKIVASRDDQFVAAADKIELSNGTARRDIAKLKDVLTESVSISFRKDLTRMFVSYRDGTAALIDADNGKEVLRLFNQYLAKDGGPPHKLVAVNDGRLVFDVPDRSSRGRSASVGGFMGWTMDRLVTLGDDGSVTLRNSWSGSPIASLRSPSAASDIRYLDFVMDERMILLIAADQEPILFNSTDGSIVASHDPLQGMTLPPSLAWSLQFLHIVKQDTDCDPPGRTGCTLLHAGDKVDYDVSGDGARYLIGRNGSSRIFRTADHRLEALIGAIQGQSPSRFEDKEGKRVRSTKFTWELSEMGRQRSAELRAWMCSGTRKDHEPKVFIFSEAERRENPHLKGRPADICDWQGLKSWQGWRQTLDRWRYLLTGRDVGSHAQANSPPE